jgi:serine protease Do
MKINYQPLIIALGFSLTFAQCEIATASGLSRAQLYAQSKKITVLISGSNSRFGSGVIVKKEGNTYTVVTNTHVINYKNVKHEVVTHNNQRYPINLKNIKTIPGFDLASVQFISQNNYETATLGDSSNIGIPIVFKDYMVYSAGFIRSSSTNKPTYNFLLGKVLENTSEQEYKPQFHDEGYDLSHTSQIRDGMSGGPILNVKGELVGINGRVIYRGKFKELYKSLGIPINTIKTHLLPDTPTITTSKASGCGKNIFANVANVCTTYPSTSSPLSSF